MMPKLHVCFTMYDCMTYFYLFGEFDLNEIGARNSWGDLLCHAGTEEVALGLVPQSSKKANMENKQTDI